MKNMTFKTSKIVCVGAIMMAGFINLAVAQQSTQTQPLPATFSSGSNTYIGTYYAWVKATNSAGSILIMPTNGVQSCTIQDVSGYPSPYSSAFVVQRKSDGHWWYTNNNNSLTFPVAHGTNYTICLYVSSAPPPPTNGQPIMLQIQWSTNSISSTN